jgi:hypothetical protein
MASSVRPVAALQQSFGSPSRTEELIARDVDRVFGMLDVALLHGGDEGYSAFHTVGGSPALQKRDAAVTKRDEVLNRQHHTGSVIHVYHRHL